MASGAIVRERSAGVEVTAAGEEVGAGGRGTWSEEVGAGSAFDATGTGPFDGFDKLTAGGIRVSAGESGAVRGRVAVATGDIFGEGVDERAFSSVGRDAVVGAVGEREEGGWGTGAGEGEGNAGACGAPETGAFFGGAFCVATYAPAPPTRSPAAMMRRIATGIKPPLRCCMSGLL
jgi:hypothetical protein